MEKLKVLKRNGNIVDFDKSKITQAIEKAYNAALIQPNYHIINQVAAITEEYFTHTSNGEPVTIDDIQSRVEQFLMVTAPHMVVRKYITYRDRRDKDRLSFNKLTMTFHDVVDIEDNDTKKSNANINGNTPAGQMMIFASESSKQHAFDYIVNPKYVQAHKDGYIHIHDADYISTKAWNCNHLDLVELFEKPIIYTTDSEMRQPKRISSYGALAAIMLQSEQNEMFGGQSIAAFDYAMAKGVRKSFLEHFREISAITKENRLYFKDERVYIGNEDLAEAYLSAYPLALEKTIKDTHEACAAFIYNLCSMHSRGGGQIVFSSINYGTDTSPEGRIVIEQTLKAIDEGLGSGNTAIFPISVFKVKNGINFSEEDWELAKNNWDDAVNGKLEFKTPNFDLFIKACVVSSHRLFPNFIFEDTPYNFNPKWDEKDPDRYKYELSCMGCRTRVYDDIYGEKTCQKRGNLSFTTINLPRLAIESRLECIEELKEFTSEDVIKRFYSKLDYYLNLAHDQLIERFKWQSSAYGKQFPFILKNNTVKGTEYLTPDSHVGEALKHGSLSIGFIGLAETLIELIGSHHGESAEAQTLGLEIIGHMRNFTDSCIKKDNLNFSLFSSPSEGLSGRFTSIDKNKFGVIKGVTDKEYYTNSSHIPVYYKISAAEKIKLEAPYHALTNAGHIAYVEMDGDPRKNTLAFASVVVEMWKNNIGYGAINHAVDRCQNCSFEGVIKDECPQCGEKEHIDRIRRITGYLVGTIDRWNSFKLAELRDRIKHS